MNKNERIEKVVQKVVKKIIRGKYDVLVINELASLAEFCDRNNYSKEELKDVISLIAYDSFTIDDYKKVIVRLKESLLDIIVNDKLSYLQVLRIIESLSVLGFDKEIKNKNNKIKFCREFSRMAGQYYFKMSECFKCIDLL